MRVEQERPSSDARSPRCSSDKRGSDNDHAPRVSRPFVSGEGTVQRDVSVTITSRRRFLAFVPDATPLSHILLSQPAWKTNRPTARGAPRITGRIENSPDARDGYKQITRFYRAFASFRCRVYRQFNRVTPLQNARSNAVTRRKISFHKRERERDTSVNITVR